MPETNPAVTRFGGPLILAVLIKWRRPESWLIAVLALVPQTPAFYSTIPVFTVPANIKESAILAATMMIGTLLGAMFIETPKSLAELNWMMGALQVFTIYLPAVVFILRRPNVGPMPAWLQMLSRLKTTTR
jgi:hypothetical protein